MTPYHYYFFPILGAGCLLAAASTFWAARIKNGFVLPAILVGIGFVSVWASLVIGSGVGYQVWQSMPNPPDEAFNDTSNVGAVLVGWIPAGGFCCLVFTLTKIACANQSNKRIAEAELLDTNGKDL
ncbi:MAG: hypothetical protein AAGA30_21325 [Planctomycetota bacterium]